MSARAFLPLVVALGAVSTSACTVQTDDTPTTAAPAAGDGSVTVDWTISGGKNGSDCDSNSASQISVDVTASDGSSAGSYTASCDAFSLQISLPPGEYTADAELEDSSGNARTTDVPIDSFHIIAGTDLDVPIDFPSDSFK